MPDDKVLPSAQTLFKLLEVIAGPSVPNVLSMTTYPVSLSANTQNQQIIPAPGTSKRVFVLSCLFIAGSADGTVSMHDNLWTYFSGEIPLTYHGGFVMQHSGNFGMPWIAAAENRAIMASTSVCSIHGIITYAIVSTQ